MRAVLGWCCALVVSVLLNILLSLSLRRARRDLHDAERRLDATRCELDLAKLELAGARRDLAHAVSLLVDQQHCYSEMAKHYDSVAKELDETRETVLLIQRELESVQRDKIQMVRHAELAEKANKVEIAGLRQEISRLLGQVAARDDDEQELV